MRHLRMTWWRALVCTAGLAALASSLPSCVRRGTKEGTESPASLGTPSPSARLLGQGSPDGRPLPRSSSPVPLARDGRALLPIVIAASASARTKAVAHELADHLGKITGARFSIESGDGHRGIVLGTSGEFPEPSLGSALEIRDRYDGREAFAIRAEPAPSGGRVLLVGATDLGASHAAFRFLELLGCRWFFMSPAWTVIPSSRDLSFDLDETTRPRVLARQIWFNYGIPNERGPQDYEAWTRHNRLGQSFSLFVSHMYGAIMEVYKQEFATHPEYYSLHDGKRVPRHLCLSNPAVRALAVRYARDYLDKHPDADMVSMEPSDGVGWCTCAACMKLGSVSDRAFGLANEVARAIAQTHPGKMIGILAYYQHADPPTFPLEPNVHVELAAGLNGGDLSFEEQLQRWKVRSDNRGIYEYLSMYPWGQDRLRAPSAAGPAASVQGLAQRLRRYIAWGMKSLSAESACNFGKFGRGYYAAARVMWDPDTDVRALMDDFYERAFGPAAAPMRRYYERLDPTGAPLFGPDLLARAYRDVEESSKLAIDRPDVLARIDEVKQYLYFNYIQWNELKAKGAEDKKRWTLAKLAHVYRTQNDYVVHAVPILQEAPHWAKELDEPSWAERDAPWKRETPYSRDEIEKNFREGLAFFVPQKKIERSFAKEVVAVEFGGQHVSSAFAATESLKISALSLHGEPVNVTFNVAPGPAAQLFHYHLDDASGTVVGQGEIAADPSGRKEYAVAIQVPKAGTYLLSGDRANTLYSFPEGTTASVPLTAERSTAAYVFGSAGQFYFYVPKGTREISFFFDAFDLKLYAPDGKLLEQLEANGDFKLVPVPPGADGKLFRLGGRIGHLVFFNVPNWVALSPDQLLVPKDVAIADGLKLRR